MQIEIDESKYLSFNTIKDITGISSQTLRKLVKAHNIPHISNGNTYDEKFISKEIVQKYILNENYLHGYELLNLLGIDKLSKTSLPRRALTSVIDTIKKDNDLCLLLGYKKLEYPLYFKNFLYPTDEVFSRELVLSFLDSHIATRQILNEFKMQRGNLVSMLENHKIPMYTFYSNHDFKFISKEHYQYLKELNKIREKGTLSVYLKNEKYRTIIKEGNHYTKEDIRKILNISRDSIDSVLEKCEIYPDEIIDFGFRKLYYFSKKSIDLIKQQQEDLYRYITENYLTPKQINTIFDIESYYSLIYQAGKCGNIETIECPPLLRGLIEIGTGVILYNKKQAIQYINEHIKSLNLNEVSMDDPYSEFIYKTKEILNVPFNDKLKGTKDLWYQYVRLKLSKNSQINNSGYVNLLARTTQTLSSILSKEIYNYSASSLNNILFNENVEIPVTQKRYLYDFYMNVVKSFNEKIDDAKFQVDLIKNPYKFSNTKKIDLTRYSYKDYQELYKYAKDLSIHKHRAIQDVEAFINGDTYHNYDSYWAYILTHLTNNWRHSTIVSVLPQIDLSYTSIINLEWLKDNNPSVDDANSIIFQIGRTVKEISKTGAIAEFRIAEPLKIPFATAISICQLRANHFQKENKETNPNIGPLIWLHNKNIIQPHHALHKLFFIGFLPNFKFSNRKMNKTLTSLIWSVYKSLKVAQFSRSHFSEDSTMHYINLSDEQLHDLVMQIFERNSFGYISHLLVDKMFMDSSSREIETMQILALNEKFGDTHKIEVTSGFLNRVTEQQDDVIKFVNELSHEESQEIILKSLTNTLYSKQRYFQCVFSSCKFSSDSTEISDCISCAFSIINVYALSNLMDLYLNQIENLITNFDSAKIGEKHKLANHFFLLWKQIESAKIRFGDIIYEFVDGGKDRLKSLSKQLPKTKEYITISQD